MRRKVKEKGERMSETDRERNVQKICFHLNFFIVKDSF